MNFYKTEDGRDFLKENDKVWMALDCMVRELDNLAHSMRSDYDDKVREDEDYEDSDAGEQMFDKIEEIIDMKDKLEEYKEEVNDYVLYDNEAFDNAY